MYLESLLHSFHKVQGPIPQHSLVKEVEQSYWMMFLALVQKQSLRLVAMTPILEIAIMGRMLVLGVMVSDNRYFCVCIAMKILLGVGIPYLYTCM